MTTLKVRISQPLKNIRHISASLIDDEKAFQDRLEAITSDGNRERARSLSGQYRSLQDQIRFLEKEMQTAREDSFKAGYEQGKQTALQEAERRIEVIRIEMKSMEIKYLETIENIETPLLEIARRMAAEVLNTEISLHPDQLEILKNRMRKMLYEVVDQHKVIVEVNPVHLDKLNEMDINKEMDLPRRMDINFAGNKNLRPGEARIETDDFYIDGTFEGQLNKLRDDFLNEASK
jgi:flagellar assembly protein FliH